jgi:hypothetical protein
VRNVFERTRNGSLPEMHEVCENVQALKGRKQTSLQTLIERNRSAFGNTPTQ